MLQRKRDTGSLANSVNQTLSLTANSTLAPPTTTTQNASLPKKPISSGQHLSHDPKVADGSAVGKQISKNEQIKKKEDAAAAKQAAAAAAAKAKEDAKKLETSLSNSNTSLSLNTTINSEGRLLLIFI